MPKLPLLARLLAPLLALAGTVTILEIAKTLNRILDNSLRCTPAGCFSLVTSELYDPATRTLRFTNAGHPPPLLFGGGESRYLEDALAPPLGRPGPPRSLRRIPSALTNSLTTTSAPSRFALSSRSGIPSTAMIRLAKESLNGIEDGNLEDKYRWEQGFTLQAYMTKDSAETRAAFVEKRQAQLNN